MSSPLTAVLSLGSNLGDRERILAGAVDQIGALDGVRLGAVSGLVQTPAIKPNGVDESAPAYLNLVTTVTTTLEPKVLLAALNRIENDNGRVREVRWGDRTLDIDIVSIGDLQLSTDSLTLPHPRAAERGFVLVPWLEIDPGAVLPGIGALEDLPAAHEDVSRYRGKGDS